MAHKGGTVLGMLVKGREYRALTVLKKMLPILAVSCLLLSPSLGVSPVGKKIPPHTRKDICQTWVGISEDESCLFRMSFQEDGRGKGAYVYLNDEPRAFEIESWNFDMKKRIELNIPPVPSTDLEYGRMEGSVIGFRMELTLFGKAWKEKINLRPEAPLRGRWEKLHTAMQEKIGQS